MITYVAGFFLVAPLASMLIPWMIGKPVSTLSRGRRQLWYGWLCVLAIAGVGFSVIAAGEATGPRWVDILYRGLVLLAVLAPIAICVRSWLLRQGK